MESSTWNGGGGVGGSQSLGPPIPHPNGKLPPLLHPSPTNTPPLPRPLLPTMNRVTFLLFPHAKCQRVIPLGRLVLPLPPAFPPSRPRSAAGQLVPALREPETIPPGLGLARGVSDGARARGTATRPSGTGSHSPVGTKNIARACAVSKWPPVSQSVGSWKKKQKQKKQLLPLFFQRPLLTFGGFSAFWVILLWCSHTGKQLERVWCVVYRACFAAVVPPSRQNSSAQRNKWDELAADYFD